MIPLLGSRTMLGRCGMLAGPSFTNLPHALCFHGTASLLGCRAGDLLITLTPVLITPEYSKTQACSPYQPTQTCQAARSQSGEEFSATWHMVSTTAFKALGTSHGFQRLEVVNCTPRPVVRKPRVSAASPSSWTSSGECRKGLQMPP